MWTVLWRETERAIVVLCYNASESPVTVIVDIEMEMERQSEDRAKLDGDRRVLLPELLIYVF